MLLVPCPKTGPLCLVYRRRESYFTIKRTHLYSCFPKLVSYYRSVPCPNQTLKKTPRQKLKVNAYSYRVNLALSEYNFTFNFYRVVFKKFLYALECVQTDNSNILGIVPGISRIGWLSLIKPFLFNISSMYLKYFSHLGFLGSYPNFSVNSLPLNITNFELSP